MILASRTRLGALCALVRASGREPDRRKAEEKCMKMQKSQTEEKPGVGGLELAESEGSERWPYEREERGEDA